VKLSLLNPPCCRISFETVKTVSNGVVKDLEAKAEEEEPPFGLGADESETGDDNAAGEEESSDEDVRES
jgi:pre-mRNA 3'-end-processing factor FIP1